MTTYLVQEIRNETVFTVDTITDDNAGCAARVVAAHEDLRLIIVADREMTVEEFNAIAEALMR